jgi:transcriptional regulator with XRE-family HTH domain
MGKNFRDTLNEQLKNPAFKSEYEPLEVEYQIINAVLDARKQKNITQKELSKITGIAQGDISKIERNGNPSLKTLQKIASGLGMAVKIEFVEQYNNQL